MTSYLDAIAIDNEDQIVNHISMHKHWIRLQWHPTSFFRLEARTLSLKAIYKGGEDKAYATFRRYALAGRRKAPPVPALRCIEGLRDHHAPPVQVPCLPGHQFSVTSGTIFASRKLALRRLSVRRDCHLRERREGRSLPCT